MRPRHVTQDDKQVAELFFQRVSEQRQVRLDHFQPLFVARQLLGTVHFFAIATAEIHLADIHQQRFGVQFQLNALGFAGLAVNEIGQGHFAFQRQFWAADKAHRARQLSQRLLALKNPAQQKAQVFAHRFRRNH